jgi:hypothetical protein
VVELFVLAIIRGVMWNISVVLICISFMCFLAIWTSSLQKFCLVQLPTSLLVL